MARFGPKCQNSYCQTLIETLQEDAYLACNDEVKNKVKTKEQLLAETERLDKEFQELWDFADRIRTRVDRLGARVVYEFNQQRSEIQKDCKDFQKRLKKLDRYMRPGSKLVEKGGGSAVPNPRLG